MNLPQPRGAISQWLASVLTGPIQDQVELFPGDPADPADPADAALSLWILHELCYRGFDSVDDRWEWQPDLLRLRHSLERGLEMRLRERWNESGVDRRPAENFVDQLISLIEDHSGPSLARHVQHHATRDQAEHLLRQRSIYHLKEADPTSWVLPRLQGRSKAALMEVQFDEYGNGDPSRLHHHLFAQGLATSGLDHRYGAYIDEAVLEILEQNNALSMFGLQRRLRGAALGHLAAFESTSSLPSRQLGQGLRRLGFTEEMVHYYDEHIEADAVHEQLALRDICGALVEDEPGLAEDVLYGAWSCLDLESRTANRLLGTWEAA